MKDFESDLKSCHGAAADPSVGIAEFHHDDDKSFRSHVGDYARDKGWVDIHTQVVITLMATLLLRGGPVCSISQPGPC